MFERVGCRFTYGPRYGGAMVEQSTLELTRWKGAVSFPGCS